MNDVYLESMVRQVQPWRSVIMQLNSLTQQRSLWKHLEAFGQTLSFGRHSLIYTPSQPAQKLYLLQSGQVNLQLIASSGRALTLQVVDMGQIFGHSVLDGSQTYDTFAEVTRPASVRMLSHEDVQQALKAVPDLGLMFLEILGKYRRDVSRRLDEVTFKSVPARLASLLLDMADMAPGEELARLPRRTHQQLAEMINAYRETVTKVINQFQAARLLDMDRSGITLLNPSGLRELAQS
jgi:CRP-like cAMP-binding protein